MVVESPGLLFIYGVIFMLVVKSSFLVLFKAAALKYGEEQKSIGGVQLHRTPSLTWTSPCTEALRHLLTSCTNIEVRHGF